MKFVERKIIQVSDNMAEAAENPQIKFSKTVKLDCGHEKEMNPIFTYREGERVKCFQCKGKVR